jgi:hypothetical protein
MKKRLILRWGILGDSLFVFLYFSAYFILVRREDYSFDGQFRRIIPEGSLHQVARYRYFDDTHFVVTRIFQPAHTIDVFIRPQYWSKPDNQ